MFLVAELWEILAPVQYSNGIKVAVRPLQNYPVQHLKLLIVCGVLRDFFLILPLFLLFFLFIGGLMSFLVSEIDDYRGRDGLVTLLLFSVLGQHCCSHALRHAVAMGRAIAGDVVALREIAQRSKSLRIL